MADESGSSGAASKFQKHNAAMKSAISERTAAGVKKTAAKKRNPFRMSKATRDSIPF